MDWPVSLCVVISEESAVFFGAGAVLTAFLLGWWNDWF